MAKHRPRLGANGVFYTPDPTGYEERVAAAWIAEHGHNPLTGPVTVALVFRFGHDSGVAITVAPCDKPGMYAGRPDGDNVEKAILDALGPDNSQATRREAARLGLAAPGGIAWLDDAQIVRLSWQKVKT